MVDPLAAVSPLDGRYADRTAPLRQYVSESALARERVHVEVSYVLALAAEPEIPLSLSEPEQGSLKNLYEEFDQSDAARIHTIETEGTADRPATHHDVKAVEYFIRDNAPEEAKPWVHFGLTSEDVNNLARRLLIREALEEVLLPAFNEVQTELRDLAQMGRAIPMPARTHGQPASPTTFGKEYAVYATRLARELADVRTATAGLQGKCSGATGTYAAQVIALPDVEWRGVTRSFITELGLEPVEPTTQVNPGDDLAEVFDTLGRVAGVCLDCARDSWQYTADGYLRQDAGDEVGSSTMPHKVNPIDFENAEGNFAKAQADLDFLSRYLVTSRLQRDLSDSTVKRTIGGTLGHLLLAADRLAEGLTGVVPDTDAMAADLGSQPAVLAEAVQTLLRVTGHDDAYERVKAKTHGKEVTKETLQEILRDAEVPPEIEERFAALRPEDYTGLAAELADLAANK